MSALDTQAKRAYSGSGPHKRDWNKVGHVVVVVLSITLGAPILWHMVMKWGQW